MVSFTEEQIDLGMNSMIGSLEGYLESIGIEDSEANVIELVKRIAPKMIDALLNDEPLY